MNNWKYTKPMDIENRSMEIITQEMQKRGIVLEPQTEHIVRRVIHTTADFEYAHSMYFSPGATIVGQLALQTGADIVTDTRMAQAGINQSILEQLGGRVHCFMADEDVAAMADLNGTTRAVASIDKAVRELPGAIYAIGNAPTALIRLCELIKRGEIRPALIIGVPVGFVNVVEAKEMLIQSGVSCIVARGRKGGSNVAAAICNAMLYQGIDRG